MIHSLISLALPCNRWIIVLSVSVVVRLVENLLSYVLLCASWVLARNIFLSRRPPPIFVDLSVIEAHYVLPSSDTQMKNFIETIQLMTQKTRHLLFSLLLVYNKLKFGQNDVGLKCLES